MNKIIRKFGDRKDAVRLPVPGLMQCCMDLKPGRMENEVYINRSIDVTDLCEFLRKARRKENTSRFSTPV